PDRGRPRASEPVLTLMLVHAGTTPRDTVRAPMSTGRGRQSQRRGRSLKRGTATLSRNSATALYAVSPTSNRVGLIDTSEGPKVPSRRLALGRVLRLGRYAASLRTNGRGSAQLRGQLDDAPEAHGREIAHRRPRHRRLARAEDGRVRARRAERERPLAHAAD